MPTVTARPDATVAADSWVADGGGNHHDKVNEVVTDPTVPSTAAGTFCSMDLADIPVRKMILGLGGTPTDVSTATQIVVKAYASTDAAFGTARIGYTISGAGGQMGAVFSGAAAWRTATFSGLSLTQADINNLEVAIDDQGSSEDFGGDVKVYAMYVEITYTAVAAPEMRVTGGLDVTIPDGDTTPTGADNTAWTALAGDPSESKQFKIWNDGTANLTFSAPTLTMLSGTPPGSWTLTTSPTSPVAPAGSSTFTLTFHPSIAGTGSWLAEVSITNNDADENPYTFRVGSDVSGGGGQLEGSAGMIYESPWHERMKAAGDPVLAHLRRSIFGR